MEKMAEVHDGSLVPVRILEVKTGGEFVSMPLGRGYEDEYSLFLADLNNYMNELNSSEKLLSCQHLRKGELVAVYCKEQKDDDEKLWYRGRLLSKFKTVNGITIKALLVDYGSIVYVPGTLMRKLEMRYQDFPIQKMTCCFYGLKPLAYIATHENLVSRQVVKKWDSSAKTRVQELSKGASGRIFVHKIDEAGTFHVTLFIAKVERGGKHHDINVNELLVEENYAVFENPLELMQDDDGASTVSESSLQDVEEIQKALKPDEFENLMESKKMEEKRFILGIDSHMDAYREVFGLPARESQSAVVREDYSPDSKKSKSYGMKMTPANCEDGVDLNDDQSCINSEPLSKIVKQKTEELINKMMSIDRQTAGPQGSNIYTSQQSKDDVKIYGMKMTPANCEDDVDLTDDLSCISSEPLSKIVKQKTEELINEMKTIDRQTADPQGSNIYTSQQSKDEVKSYGMKMIPANCEDGVDLTDDQSCISSEPLSKIVKQKTEDLINKMMAFDLQTADPQGSNIYTSQQSKDDRNMNDLQVRSRKETGISLDSPSVTRNNPPSKFGLFENKHIWSVIRQHENEVQSSSLSESEIETSDKIGKHTNGNGTNSDDSQDSTIIPGDNSNKVKTEKVREKYEKVCLKQQNKDRGDRNSFQTVNSTLQLLKDLGVGDAIKTKWKSKTADAEVVPTAGEEILVCGDNRPKCVLSLEELNVPHEMRCSIRHSITDALVTKPTPLQSFVWPTVLRGRHVVGIDGASSGKKLAYLLPVLKQIVDTQSLYKNLPKGHGPIVLILTTDWNEVRKICKICEKLLYSHRTKYRSKMLYGGRGNIQEEMVSLINGCEVLVSTIPSLLGMMEKHCTNLERLCHLVFDTAHILVDNFAEEIKMLMRLYADSLSKTIALNLPHQLIAMSSEWSRGLESLLNAYFDNPLIIIPNKLEASVYKNVKQLVEICTSNERMDYVMNILRGDYADHNVVIFVNSAKEADSLVSLLESQCFGVLKATEFMSPIEVKDVQASWNYEVRSRKQRDFVLILTDRVAPRISIRNATCIINYEFPMNKSDFGRRLSFFLEAMKEKTDKSKDIVSVVFVTEECENVAPSFAKLLKRARQHLPPNLDSIAQKVIQQKEERAKNCEICEDLKYFGTCRNFQHCTQRHTLFADSDEPKHIPKSGVVKVKILDVVSANVYWGKILDHKLPCGANISEAYDTKAFFKLAYDMQVFYAIKSNRKRHGLTPEGVLEDDICVIKAEDGFQRVKVESIVRRDAQTAIATEVFVFGIDNGISQKISVTDLYFLPTDKSFSLKNVPQQAIELIVCGVKPVDKSFSWTIEACLKMNRLICGKTFEGKIALGLRNTLWLDPLVRKTKYDELNANITTLHVGAFLLECGFAQKNRSHTKNLRELCKDCLPSVVNAVELAANQATKEESSTTIKRSQETEEMPESDYQDVYVSAVDSPGLFFVQLWKNVKLLDKLEDKIEAVMKVLPKHEEPNISQIGRGTMCLAKFSLDDKWYRARVLEVNEEFEFRVFFVDHGDMEWVEEKRLWKAWPEILEFPCQAIECCLVHISPQGEKWSSEDGDCFWNLCENKLLVAQVKSTVGSDFAGANRYNIELYDTTGTSTINMSHELVFLGRAFGSQDCIQEIFPDALWCPENREVTNAVDRLPDLCLQIYRHEVASKQMELVQELHDIVENASGDESTIFIGTKSIVKLLALCQSKDVIGTLIDTIVCLMRKNNRLSNEILREGGLRTLCNLLNQEPCDSNSRKLITALSYFTEDSSYKQALSGYVCVESVCKVLKESRSVETVYLCLEFLSSVCKGNDAICERLLENDGIPTLVHLAKISSDVKVMELCSLVLFVLAQNFRIREKLREMGVIDVIGVLLSKTNSKVCLLNCLATLKMAISNNEMHREHVRRTDMIPAIERILYIPLTDSSEVKRLCKQLLAKLEMQTESRGSGQRIIQIPKIELGNEPPPLLSLDELQCVTPKTLWSQREGDVTLAIQLRGVQNEEVEIGERTVVFRCFTDEFKYQLDLDLFDIVIPESSKWQVHGGEVLIILVKLQKRNWPRLLSSRVKPPFLYMDFNRWTLDVEDEHVAKPRKLPPRGNNIRDANISTHRVPDMYYSDSDSSDDEDTSSSDLCDEYGPIT